jgi:hypothetical protein
LKSYKGRCHIQEDIYYHITYPFALPLYAEELGNIKLSPQQLDSGKSLMQALKDRQSTRSFSLRQLPLDVLSNLLWAADGINRA